MKKLFLSLWAACGLGSAYAQTNDSLSYTAQQDQAFIHLDKSRIATGALYDRVFPWADLTAFSSREDKNVDYAFARQAWYELQLAAYHFDQPVTYAGLQEKIALNELNHKGISIGYIDYDFNSIDTNALQNGSLYYGADSLLYDGASGNPYLSHRLCIPFISSLGISSGTVAFYFDPALALSNTGRRVQSISLYGPDGKSLTLLPGQSGNLELTGNPGDSLNLQLQLNWKEGGVTTVPAILGIHNLLPLSSTTTEKCFKNDILWSGSSLLFKGYDELTSSQGYGNYKIFYHQQGGSWTNCDEHIRKPIIIIDGFDPGDGRAITSTFKNGEWQPGIWDLLSYGNDKHLGDELRLKGYDVIVLNFPNYQSPETGALRDGGADYIERNAMVLVKLIQTVNAELQQNGSTEKIVVVGPSMGGQVARYALAYMEKQQNLGVANMDHNTRLYVSFDSPHKGANIPVAAQQALFYLGKYANQTDALDSYNGQLRTAAARQMLIEQIDGLNHTAAFHSTYYNALNSGGLANTNGWPVQLRKVALINGNAAGITTNGIANRIFHVNANTLAGTIKAIDMNLYNMPDYNSSLETFNGYLKAPAWGFGVYNYLINIPDMPANMSGTSQDIYSGFAIAYGLHTYKGKFITTNMNPNGSLDVAPGGTYSTIKILKDKIAESLKGQTTASTINWEDIRISHCFIPSVSSLAFKNTGFNWSTAVNSRNLVCTGEIPFDNYYAPPANEEHVSLSEASAQWISEEIEKGQPNCPQICKSTVQQPNNVSAPLCINSSRTFYHNYTLTAGATVSWSIDESVLQKISANNNAITVNAIATSAGTPVTYTISNPCGANISGTFNLVTGLPDVGEIAYAINTNTNMVKAEPFIPQQVNYSWSWDNTTYNNLNVNPYPATFPQTSVSGSIQKLWLKVENVCGTATQFVHPTLPAAPITTSLKMKLTVYPNPSHSNWTVDLPGSVLASLTLYDLTGRVVWSAAGKSISVEVPGTGLVAGVYLLKVQAGAQQYHYKLVKE